MAAMPFHLAPDYAPVHAVLGQIQLDQKQLAGAKVALEEAIRLDPHDEDNFAGMARYHLMKKDWQSALECAEQGLAIEPDDPACNNFRAYALERMGKAEIAVDAAKQALGRNPDDANSHAIHGWALLNKNQHRLAQESFREALRLDPGNEFARTGMIESLNANNIIYRWIFRWYSAMSRLSVRVQWMVIIGFLVLQRFLNVLAANNPAIRPFVIPLIILYLLFVVLTWIAQPLFNTFLRFHSFGKYLLNRDEIVASNWIVAMGVFGVVSALVAMVVTGFWQFAIFFLLYAIFMLLPISGVFRCPRGWRRWLMIAITVVVGACGLTYLGAALFNIEAPPILIPIFFYGNFGAQLLSNFLVMDES